MFAAARRHRHQERQAERHQARRRHRDDAAEEAVPVQPVRVRADPQPLPRPRGPGVACPTTTTTTSSARASPTRRRGCGSRTKPSGSASRRAPTRSARPNPASSRPLMEWGLSYESRPDSRLDALLGLPRRGVPARRHGWTNERVVVFTEYAHTVDWLTRVLTQHGLRRRARRDPGLDPDRGPRVHPLAVHRGPGEGAGPGAAGHRCRRRGHRPADPLPPAGQLRHPVQPVAARAAHRPHRPLRADPRAAGVPLRPRRRTRRTYAADAELHGPHRQEGRQGRAGPRLGQPGDRRGDPGALRPPARRRDARPRASIRTRSSTRRWPAASSSTPA